MNRPTCIATPGPYPIRRPKRKRPGYHGRQPGSVTVIVPVRSSFELVRGANYNHIRERARRNIVLQAKLGITNYGGR